MNLSERITESQIGYAHESSTRSSLRSLSNVDSEDGISATTPMHPVSQPSATILPQLRNSLPSRPHSFPYQATTIIDDRLRELTLKYEIQEELGERLRALQDYEIIILCDDSGSMKTIVDNSNRTRWDELRDIVKIVLEIGTIFDTNGVDIHFLNRRSIYNVTDPNSVDDIFHSPPRGYTPLVTALKYIFNLPASRRGNDKKLLVFIATDGAPTDDKGTINVEELEHLMNHQRRIETTHVMFLICTDDPTCVDYLNEWDRKMINVDVTDDFKTEREKIRKFQGPNYPFSKGDYIVKALIGAIDTEIDNLNEPKPTNNNNNNNHH